MRRCKTIRTKFDPNEIVSCEEYAEIILYDKENNEKSRAIIDKEYIPVVTGVKWYQRSDGYVASNNYKGNGYTFLHAVIMNKPSEKNIYIDHRDGNRLNNLRCNLRLATPSQNGMNKRIRSNNTSGIVGVHWAKDKSKWCAMICANGKHINLGYYKTIEEASARRDEAENRYFGCFGTKESRRLNA